MWLIRKINLIKWFPTWSKQSIFRHILFKAILLQGFYHTLTWCVDTTIHNTMQTPFHRPSSFGVVALNIHDLKLCSSELRMTGQPAFHWQEIASELPFLSKVWHKSVPEVISTFKIIRGEHAPRTPSLSVYKLPEISIAQPSLILWHKEISSICGV